MENIKIELFAGFAWQFINLPEVEGEIVLSEQYKKQKLSDINIGFDKSNRKEFLEKIENLSRKEVNVKLVFPLNELEPDTPHHLDNRKEFINYGKKTFSNLIIERIKEGKEIEIDKENLILKFGRFEISEFFMKMYVNFEIYATYEDNIIEMVNSKTNEKLRLVIWGVYKGNPIYY